MSTVAAFVEGDAFGFEHVTEFTRQRAVLVTDPYDPEAPGVPSWDDPDEVTVYGYLASSSSVESGDATRAQVVTTKQLILDDPAVDVERGDRIVQGSRVWTVTGFPDVDVNPFTGWQPTRVCNLEEGVG